ncbi:uncharacterized protein CcaverHIS019_0208090 [Cutaneotrichosporon cavernicola]|uniref:MFS general substrate transporter n=1 Tax=Cutaneotrichosporon cavernicola TaxID=279322 RepID=A0AA48IAX4_9TREE|nr:uncharacterized protein CcaverHIS019_0208090 [Cutaneotrichosporon cavernicola]BEI89447.1 hypothetical protein CcaverHIS019_0208090 [Cutaneotrichosporon cavernicola]
MIAKEPNHTNVSKIEEVEVDPAPTNVLAPLPARKKGILLFCFCLAVFMDVAGTSAAFIMTAPIAADLGLDIGNSIWIVYAYGIPFAALLLFAGRVADLYSPSLVFASGFLGCGVLNLVISFMTNKYAFLILRAISAVFAVFTLPSSVNMIGADLLLALLVLFMLSWTQVEGQGWNNPLFIAPLVISLVLLPLFLLWENKLPVGFSLLPHGMWRFPNMAPLVISALTIFLWYAPYQLRMATYFQVVLHDSAIITGVKILPMGVTACIVGGVAQHASVLHNPRYSVPISSILCFGSGLLLAFSGGGHGKDYWRYIFPSQIIGTMGAMVIYVIMNTVLIQTFPQDFAGVAGSFVQVLFQIGAAIGNAAQAGFLGAHTDSAKQGEALADWTTSRNSFFFTSAVIGASGVAFALLFRHDLMPKAGLEDQTVAAEAEREGARDAEARQVHAVPTIN